MLLLMIRTDKPEAELGLYENDTQLAYESWHAHRALAETLHDKVNALLQAHNTQLHNLEGIVYQDIRDVIPQGIVVNDYDVLTEPEELVRLHKLMQIGFDPRGKQVITVSKKRIGKVSDYATEIETMYIQKLYVAQSMLKSLTGGSLGIDRNQIVEVTPKKIIVQELLKPVPAGATVAA